MAVHLYSRPDYRSVADTVAGPVVAMDTDHTAADPDSPELQHTSYRIQEVAAEVLWRSHSDQVEVVASLEVAGGIGCDHSDCLATVAGYTLGMSYATGCHSSGFLLVLLRVLLRVLPLYHGIHHVVPGHQGCGRILLHGPSFAEYRPR